MRICLRLFGRDVLELDTTPAEAFVELDDDDEDDPPEVWPVDVTAGNTHSASLDVAPRLFGFAPNFELVPEWSAR